jgi:hypothetical protein
MSETSMETTITVRQAYLVMFEYLDTHWKRTGDGLALSDILSNLALWNFDSGIGQKFIEGQEASMKRPMDGAVFPDWIQAASDVLSAEASPGGYRGADIELKH